MKRLIVTVLLFSSLVYSGGFSLSSSENSMLDSALATMKAKSDTSLQSNATMLSKLSSSTGVLSGGWVDSNYRYIYKMIITDTDRVAVFIMTDIYNTNSALVKMLNMQTNMVLLIDANSESKLVWNGYASSNTTSYITDSCTQMASSGMVYIPGGFDVDGDGVDESGFWASAYPASATSEELSQLENENFNAYVQSHFNLLNGSTWSYRTDSVWYPNSIYKPQFIDKGSNVDEYMGKLYGMDIPHIIANSNISSCSMDNVSYEATMLSNKQYIHIMKLLEANDGQTIKNGLLGNDSNVPSDYETKVYYMGDFREYTKDIVVLNEFTAPAYWNIQSESDIEISEYGAWADVDVGFGAPGWMDPMAIVIRKGWTIDLTFGIGSGDGTRGRGIPFRVATPYIK